MFVALALVGSFRGAPRLDHVQALLASNTFDAARVELLALADDGTSGSARAWAALHLQDVRTSDTAVEKQRAAARIGTELPEHDVAVAMVDAAFLQDAEAHLAARDAPATKAALSQLSSAARHAARAVTAAADGIIATECTAAEDWRCAFEHAHLVEAVEPVEGQRLRATTLASLQQVATKATATARVRKDLGERDRAFTDVVRLWSTLRGEDASVEPRLQEAIKLHAETTKGLLRQQEVERKREAALELRRRAQQEQEARAEAKRERQRQWWSSPLQCCDGSRSPSCTQGGSHRGCCSRHGGVCG